MKKILIITATHGNEPIGVEVIKKLKEKKLDKYFDYLVGNPKALASKQEFIDKNLNRVYPGNKNSSNYEERLAYKNMQIAKKYKYIIDIHEASQGKDDFIIVPREKLSDRLPLEFVDLKKVLLWPDPKGPISQVLENAIELEFGAKNRNREKMILKTANILKKFIECTRGNKTIKCNNKKEIFYVYGKLMQSNFKGDIGDFVDFRECSYNNEKFIPLLVSQYLNCGVICYKMKRK